MKSHIENLKIFFVKRPQLSTALVAGFALVLSVLWTKLVYSEKEFTAKEEASFSADTFIPKGHVLIPIEVANAQGLADVLGETGVVDLYATTAEGRRSGKVASHLKIVRSPVDRSMLSVLVPESRAYEVLQHPGPFYVAVQNPLQSETAFTEKAPTAMPKKSRIRIEGA